LWESFAPSKYMGYARTLVENSKEEIIYEFHVEKVSF